MNTQSVPLSKLVHDITQDAYKDLRATIDSASDADDDARRAKMLDYAMRTRHRLARLLAAVQWWSDYSAFHHSATTARDASVERGTQFAIAADALWSAAHVARAASSAAPALGPAAHILGGEAIFAPLPKLIEAAAGVDVDELQPDPDVNPYESDAVVRLGAATREFVRAAAFEECAVISWRVAPADAAVRVGVPGVWSADVLLDGIVGEQSILRVLRLDVHLAPDADALGPMRRRVVDLGAQRPIPSSRIVLTKDQEDPLRQMIQERMSFALSEMEEESGTAEQANPNSAPSALFSDTVMAENDAVQTAASGTGETPPSTKSEDVNIRRARRMLSTVFEVMNSEVASVFAMDFVRSQTSALITHRAWRFAGIEVEGIANTTASDAPVKVKYWTSSLCPSSLVIVPSSIDSSSFRKVERSASERDWNTSVVRVEHYPDVVGTRMPQVCLSSINIESVLLTSCRARARQMLLEVGSHCDQLVESFSVPESSETAQTRAFLLLSLSYTGELEVCVDLRSGAWRVRPCGSAHLASLWRSAGARSWAEARQFANISEAKDAVYGIVEALSQLSRSHLLLRQGLATDLPSMARFPPGIASLQGPSSQDLPAGSSLSVSGLGDFMPPLVAVEHVSPRAFLTLSSFDSKVDPSLVEAIGEADNRSTTASGSASGKSDGETKKEASEGEEDCSVENEILHSQPRDTVQTQVRSLKRRSTPDGFAFVQGKRPRSCRQELCGTSHAEVVPAVETWGSVPAFWEHVNLTVRRDKLLQAFLDCGIIDGVLETNDRYPRMRDKSAFLWPYAPLCTSLNVRAEPIPVISAELRLFGDCSWQLLLTLLTDSLDDYGDDTLGVGVAYSSKKQELSFRYRAVDELCVSQCKADLHAARISVLLIQRVTKALPSSFSLEQRTPCWLSARVGQTLFRIGLRDGKLQVTSSPRRPESVGLDHVVYLMEEALNASNGVSCGTILAGLLEYACPLATAIAEAVPAEAKVCRVSYSMSMRARIMLLGNNKTIHAVDLDSRSSRGVIIVDIARAAQVKGQAEGTSRRKYIPVAAWESLVRQLVRENAGKVVHSGSALIVPMSKLQGILRLLVEGVTAERLGNGKPS